MGSLAGSSAWNFMGIWAVKELGATSAQLSYGYLVMAVVAGSVGYGAGHLSDHFGRRRLILIGDGILAVYVLFFLGVGHHVWFGLALMVGAAGLGSFFFIGVVLTTAEPDMRRFQPLSANCSRTVGAKITTRASATLLLS